MPPILETPEQRHAKCLSKYHHAGIEAARSLKKASVFELQKLTKRLKKSREELAAANAEPAEHRLTSELEAAKGLELDGIATYYLDHTIQRSHKALAEYLGLQTAVVAPHRDASDAVRNVVARLLGSKTFKECIKSCIAKLEVITGLSAPKKEEEQEAAPSVRIDENHGTVAKIGRGHEAAREVPFASFHEDENVVSDDDDDDDDVSEPANDVRAAARSGAHESTFLPSLRSGYLPADNSSDDEQELQKLFPAAAQKKERKNRRGQRARRKILEAKHGNKANHIIKERVAKQKEYEERVARRAARQEARSGANAIAIEQAEKNRRERREAALRPIHGSWAIAKAQKEKMKTAKPQGVKISFE